MTEILDAHQHYWDARKTFPLTRGTWFVGAVGYPWREAGLPLLDRSFLPGELEPQLVALGVARTILVNVLHNVSETRWMLKLAESYSSIAGVVGWLDLTTPTEFVDANLQKFSKGGKLVGVRHLAQFESDPRWLVRPEVVAGLRVLEERGIPYDLLITPDQLEVVPELSMQLPDLRMVIDHAAKPEIRTNRHEPWATLLRSAAENPRVYCKLSGLVTEAGSGWTPASLAPYADALLDAFGTDRVMFGSDWPVCTLAADYSQVYECARHCVTRVVGDSSGLAERAIFGDNAARFYGIEPAPQTRFGSPQPERPTAETAAEESHTHVEESRQSKP